MSAVRKMDDPEADKRWMLVFVFCFLGFVIDGADLMLLSFGLTRISESFNLSSVEAGSLGSLTLVGMAIGGIYGGWACDRFGRVRTASWAILLFSIGTGALGLVQNYWQFAIIRTISSLGLGGLYVACSILMAEYVPTRYRTTVLGALQSGWSVGYIVATLLAGWLLPTYGWRYLFGIAVLPVGLAFLMQRSIAEPRIWQEARAARLAASQRGGGKPPAEKGAYRAILTDPATRKTFSFWCLTAGLLQFGYYGVTNWLPSYLEKEKGLALSAMTVFLIGGYVAAILGKILAGAAADIVGRKAIFVIGAVGTAIFLPLVVLNEDPDWMLWGMIAFGFVYGMPYAVNGTYMAESFAARYRGTAVGGAYNIGRAGAAIAPIAIGYLASQWSIGMGFLVLGGAYFLSGVVPALFIREKQFDPQTQ